MAEGLLYNVCYNKWLSESMSAQFCARKCSLNFTVLSSGRVVRPGGSSWSLPVGVDRSTLLLMALGVNFGIGCRSVPAARIIASPRDRCSRSLDRQESPSSEATKKRKRPRVSGESPLVADISASSVTVLAPHRTADRTLERLPSILHR